MRILLRVIGCAVGLAALAGLVVLALDANWKRVDDLAKWRERMTEGYMLEGRGNPAEYKRFTKSLLVVSEDKEAMLLAMTQRAQFQLVEQGASDAIPPSCHAPYPDAEPPEPTVLLCAGLEKEALQELFVALTAVPRDVWLESAHRESWNLARLALADAESQARASATQTAQDDQLLTRFRQVVSIERPAIPLKVVLDPGTPLADARIASDRLSSFGWIVEKEFAIRESDKDLVESSPDAIDDSIVALLIDDASFVGRQMERSPNPYLTESVSVVISAPIQRWNRDHPSYGWCFVDDTTFPGRYVHATSAALSARKTG
jgi:hypothetical protein